MPSPKKSTLMVGRPSHCATSATNLRNWPKCTNQTGIPLYTAVMTPWLNIRKLLSDPAAFLSILHYSTTTPLKAWIPFDSIQIDVMWEMGPIDSECCNQIVVMFGSEFGKLKPCNEAEADRGDTTGYPKARIIIQAQALLLSCMEDVVDNVLKDVADDPVLPPQSSDDLICDGIRQAPDAETWSNLSRQAYFAPPTFDIDNFEQLARIRLESSQDHLRLLQTDPS
jgi:hypothetical protein